jgi:hypothetical protein
MPRVVAAQLWGSEVLIPTSTAPNAAQFCQPTSPRRVQRSPIACEKPAITVWGTFIPRSILAVSSPAAGGDDQRRLALIEA